MGFIFGTINGYMQGQYHLHVRRYPKEWFHSLQFVFGSFLFLLGFVINVHSDYVLTHLRKPGETGHKIPRGNICH
jgi:3-oxo-5-alpha-steroid 4-dehydrogenase 1